VQILAESDQMRKEADDTGPLAELEHWRQLMARFNALLEQIRSHNCRMVINILNVAKSKVLRVCKLKSNKDYSNISCEFVLSRKNVLQLIEFSRSGKILTSASQTMPMKQKTM
jgi:hypothetical protein